MRLSVYLFVSVLLICWAFSCGKNSGETVPKLTFISFSDSSMIQSSTNGDSITLTFSFEDGDGDIGLGDSSADTDITVYDLRTGNVYDRFKTPMLPEEGSSRGISGEITLRILSTCCIFPENIPPCSVVDRYPSNTLSLGLTIEDRAGNVSDTMKTPEIVLWCR